MCASMCIRSYGRLFVSLLCVSLLACLYVFMCTNALYPDEVKFGFLKISFVIVTIQQGRKIVWIADIKDDGAAAKARPSLQVGDIIFKIDDSFADSIDYTACMQESTKVTFTVHRRKEQKMDGDSFNSFFANIFPTGDVDSKTSDTTRNVPEKGANPATTRDVQEEAPSSLIGVVSCAKPNRLTIINYAHDDFVPMHEIVEMENKEKQKTEDCEIKEKSRRASIWEQMFGVEAASQEGSTELTQSSSPPKLLQESEVSSSSPVLSLKNTSATVEEIFAEKSLTVNEVVQFPKKRESDASKWFKAWNSPSKESVSSEDRNDGIVHSTTIEEIESDVIRKSSTVLSKIDQEIERMSDYIDNHSSSSVTSKLFESVDVEESR